MPAQVQRNTLGDLLLHEVLPAWTRGRRSLPAGDALVLGTVIFATAIVAEPGEDPETDPGTTVQIPVAVLAQDVPASDAARHGVTIDRGAVVARNALVWPADAAPEDIEGWTSQLTDAGIVVRDTI